MAILSYMGFEQLAKDWHLPSVINSFVVSQSKCYICKLPYCPSKFSETISGSEVIKTFSC